MNIWLLIAVVSAIFIGSVIAEALTKRRWGKLGIEFVILLIVVSIYVLAVE